MISSQSSDSRLWVPCLDLCVYGIEEPQHNPPFCSTLPSGSWAGGRRREPSTGRWPTPGVSTGENGEPSGYAEVRQFSSSSFSPVGFSTFIKYPQTLVDLKHNFNQKFPKFSPYKPRKYVKSWSEKLGVLSFLERNFQIH